MPFVWSGLTHRREIDPMTCGLNAKAQWHLPFPLKIIPLGTPRRLLSKGRLQSLLFRGFRPAGTGFLGSNYFHTKSVTVFSPLSDRRRGLGLGSCWKDSATS